MLGGGHDWRNSCCLACFFLLLLLLRELMLGGHLRITGALGGACVGAGGWIFLAATKHLYELSVHPSIRLFIHLSVTLSLWSCHGIFHEIFSSYYHWQKLCPWKSSRSSWLRNDAQSLKWCKGGALLFFKVICQISRSHGLKTDDFDQNWVFPDCNSSFNSQMVKK